MASIKVYTIILLAALASADALGFGHLRAPVTDEPSAPPPRPFGGQLIKGVQNALGFNRHQDKSKGDQQSPSGSDKVTIHQGTSRISHSNPSTTEMPSSTTMSTTMQEQPSSTSSSAPASTRSDAPPSTSSAPLSSTSSAPSPSTTSSGPSSTTTSAPDLGSRTSANNDTSPKALSEACAAAIQDVADEEKNKNIDVLVVLLEYGGLPGSVNITWQKNDTVEGLWTYFYGMSDFKTYIRVERGEIHSKTHPGDQQPERASGDIYWTPPELCGKMRHATYVHEYNLTLPVVLTEYCFLMNQGEVSTAAYLCQDPLSDKSQLSSGLLAALVG